MRKLLVHISWSCYKGKSLNGQITRNMLVQLLALYTNSESHNVQHYRETDGRMDARHKDANSQSHTVAVWSAKKQQKSANMTKKHQM